MASLSSCQINFDAKSFRAKAPSGKKSLYSALYTAADVDFITTNGPKQTVRFKIGNHGQCRDVFFGSSETFGPLALKLQPEIYQSNVNVVGLLRAGMEPYVVSCVWFGYVDVGGTRYSVLLQRREKPLDEFLKDICTHSGPTQKALQFLIQSVFFEVVALWRSLAHLGFTIQDAGPVNLAWCDGRVFF